MVGDRWEGDGPVMDRLAAAWDEGGSDSVTVKAVLDMIYGASDHLGVLACSMLDVAADKKQCSGGGFWPRRGTNTGG